MTRTLATMKFRDKMADAIQRSQKYMPAELWAQVRALVTPEAAAMMGTVTAFWAISHFFGAGQVADAVLLITGGAIFGMSAFKIGEEFYRFASTVRVAQTEAELEQAARHFSNAVVLGGTTVLSALLFRSRPNGTFRDRFLKGKTPRPGPRGPGLRYRPTVTVKPLPGGVFGATTTYGDIIINAKLPKRLQIQTLFHERGHQFFTPKLYFLREVRVTLGIESFSRSYLLRYLEEMLCEGNAFLRTGGDGFLSALTFPVKNGYVTVAKMGEEARGILLGPVNVGGLAFLVFFNDRQPAAGGRP